MFSAVSKWFVTFVLVFIFAFSNVSYAGKNPFKKFKSYAFGADVRWYETNGAAMKSGSVRKGSDINYYHLNIDKFRILLRLGKNDPSGELENTRRLDNMRISDVKVDGRRLPIFSWCLKNQHNPRPKLIQNAVVANDVCINTGGGGDFVIVLDNETRNILKTASEIEFVVEPYGRAIKLTYNLYGFAHIMAKINKPRPKPKPIIPVPAVKQPVAEPVDDSVIVEATKLTPVIVAKPKALHPSGLDESVAPAAKPQSIIVAVPVKKTKPEIIPVPKTKPKPKPVIVAVPKKPIKPCLAKAPVDFRSTVPAIPYPCEDDVLKEKAKNSIKGSVRYEKRKIAAEIKAARKGMLARQKANQDIKRNAEWEAKQTALWVSRCERHWKRNRSPCYCDKYLKYAPAGTQSTCL